MDARRLAVSEAAICEPKYGGKAGISGSLFKPGLNFKILSFIIGVSLISVLAFAFLLFSFQRRQVIHNAQSATTALSNMVEASLHHAMLTDDWAMANDVVQAVVVEHTIDTVRILDTHGVVGLSSMPDEVGRRFDQMEPACQFCHLEGAPPSNKTTVFAPDSGRHVLLNVNLIENQSECLACHSPENQILGLLMIETPLTSVYDQFTADFWRIALLAIATFALLVGLMVPTLRKYIIQPVGALAKGVAEISAGNLDYHVQVASHDELGKLAQSFDAMRRQLKASRAELERDKQEATALYKLGTHISTSLALGKVLNAVAEAGRELLAADVGLVGLLDEEHHEIVMKAVAGIKADALKGMRIPVGGQTSGSALDEGQPIVVEAYDPTQPIFHDGDLIANEHIVSFLVVPLQRGERFLGVVEVMTRQRRPFQQREAQLLMRLAHHVVVAIENAQLYRQLGYLVALEERDRLAREMHDHLAQALGYLNVKAGMTVDLLAGGQIDQAHESLLELKKVTKVIYTDVREAIFNLRTAISARIGLLPTLQDYLAEYRAHYGVDARLVTPDEDSTQFSPEVAGQLLRVIQEALTNVRKHSEASKAWIRFKEEDDWAYISIEDDGNGFDLAQLTVAGRQCFGLQIMRERVESVGGSLELFSQPGHGTRVVVQAPLTS
jgi:nitrate/nitrite-specific signal transduction histidine kinase